MMKRMLLSILTMLLICNRSSAAPLDARPRIRVTFVIEAAGIRSNLSAELTSCIADVQNGVRSALAARFPYFEWITTGNAPFTLTLTLKERQTSLDIEHVLTYTASNGEGNPPVHVIYEFEDPPVDDARELKTDVLARVLADVGRSEAELKSYFTTRVPLVRRLDIDKRSILLPVAGVHPESALFLVDFRDAASRRGTIQLFKPQDQPAGVYCEIEAFQFLPDIPQTTWHDQIPTVIKTKAQNVEVKVRDFTPRAFPNTSGGSVTTLPGGTP